jgi:hypothetical protein
MAEGSMSWTSERSSLARLAESFFIGGEGRVVTVWVAGSVVITVVG